MDVNNPLKKSVRYNYDNCIVRNHDDEDDSASSRFSLQLSKSTDIEHSLEEEDVTKSNKFDQPSDPPELNVNETLTLMLGFLLKLEKYFTKNATRSPEDADFKEKTVLIRKSLMKTTRKVGFKITENANGSIIITGNLDEDIKINTDDNTTNSESTSTKSHRLKKDKDSENSKETTQQGTKRKSMSSKDAKNQNSNPSSKRRKAHSYACENERLVNSATKARTAEDIRSIVGNLKGAIQSKTKSENRARNRKLSISLDRNGSRRSTSMNGSFRKSLFRPSEWLETFNLTYGLPQ